MVTGATIDTNYSTSDHAFPMYSTAYTTKRNNPLIGLPELQSKGAQQLVIWYGYRGTTVYENKNEMSKCIDPIFFGENKHQ